MQNPSLIRNTLIKLVDNFSICYRASLNFRNNYQINIIGATWNWVQILDIIMDSYSKPECSVYFEKCCEIYRCRTCDKGMSKEQ